LWGRPAREDWKILHVLEQVERGGTRRVRLGLVPDIPRFDSQAFDFYIHLLRAPVQLNRITIFDESAILNNDYILVSQSHLKHPASYPGDPRVDAYIKNQAMRFHMEDSFQLPNSEFIGLYRVQ
jgi:hypothetical protein